jgi:hypothetical protein
MVPIATGKRIRLVGTGPSKLREDEELRPTAYLCFYFAIALIRRMTVTLELVRNPNKRRTLVFHLSPGVGTLVYRV